MKQQVEVVWFPTGWAPTTDSTHTSVRAAERAARQLAHKVAHPGTIFIRIWYGPDQGERTLYRITQEVQA
jgi:hypothetical protein